MSKTHTLDRRLSLYGEKRLSDPQVTRLRYLSVQRNASRADATFNALKDMHLVRLVPMPSGLALAEITEQGRKILTSIDNAITGATS